MNLLEEYKQEWGGGGQTTIVAISDKGKRHELESHYTGYEEFSHGVSVHWYLRAKHYYDEKLGDVVEVQRYYLSTHELDNQDGKNGNGLSLWRYHSTNAGESWQLLPK